MFLFDTEKYIYDKKNFSILVVLCFSFPENSRFMPSDKKQQIFCGIINGDFYFSGNGILPK